MLSGTGPVRALNEKSLKYDKKRITMKKKKEKRHGE